MNPSAYVQAAIRGELSAVASAPIGARQTILHRAAFALGGLPGLHFAKVEDALLLAAMGTGLSEREARCTIRRGLERGRACPRSVGFGDHAVTAQPPVLPAPRVLAPNYPPKIEVDALWETAGWTSADEEVSAWLLSRGLDPAAVDLWGLARALPHGVLPGWASISGHSWRESGHRLLMPLFDAQGEHRSYRVRAVHQANKKELAPSGFEVRGLVFADPMGQRVLRGEMIDWWVPSFVLTEGGPDFLTWSSRQPDARETGPAVLGVFSGAWCPEIAARIPDGGRVMFRNHDDAAGRQYLKVVIETLGARCQVLGRGA